MFRSSAWVLAGAVMATASLAQAQEIPAPATQLSATRAAVPWYQRFTTSNGVTESITGESENDRLLTPAWSLNQRWGVTVDVRDAQRLERTPDGAHSSGQAAVGAFYQFTPRARVGAQVRVEDARSNALTSQEEQSGPSAGVRIESAFRF